MKKLILLVVPALLIIILNAFKEDEIPKGNPNPDPTGCKLKSIKKRITEINQPTKYAGFFFNYEGDKIIRANFADNASGEENNEDYVLISYNGNNIANLKYYVDNTLDDNYFFEYNSKNLISKRSFQLTVLNSQLDAVQDYVYDNKGQILYSVVTSTGTLPYFGYTTIKDSAAYTGYNNFGRPASITVFHSAKADGATYKYTYTKETAYEYDTNGNLTKESSKTAMADPFTVNRTATYDLNKTPGDAEQALRIVSRVFYDNLWLDPNITTKDIDNNLVTSETVTKDAIATTTTYTLNNRNSPASSIETGGAQTTNSTFSYDCK